MNVIVKTMNGITDIMNVTVKMVNAIYCQYDEWDYKDE